MNIMPPLSLVNDPPESATNVDSRAILTSDLSPVDLDIVATAITPALLQPYVAPQRPIALGTAATHYMRASYTPRVGLGDETSERGRRAFAAADAVAHRCVIALADGIANALGTTAVTDVDWSDAQREIADALVWRNAVVVCADALAQTADPVALVARLARVLRDSAVLVISVPLREFTVSVDDIGPPVRADRVREWAFPEMQALLDSAGLDAVFGGLVPATAANPVGQTGVFVCVRRLDQG